MKVTDKIELLNMDCMEYMRGCEDNEFDLAIVDPPYGIGNPNHEANTSKLYTGKNWNNKIPTAKYFKELFRVSNNQIIWGSNYYTIYLPMKMGWIAWDKRIPGNPNGFSKIELAWTSFVSGDELVSIRVHQKNKIHPTQKPRILYEWILEKYAKEGDKIIDTHLGSGSIAIACHNRGFELLGTELDKDYYDASIKRFKLQTAQKQLF